MGPGDPTNVRLLRRIPPRAVRLDYRFLRRRSPDSRDRGASAGAVQGRLHLPRYRRAPAGSDTDPASDTDTDTNTGTNAHPDGNGDTNPDGHPDTRADQHPRAGHGDTYSCTDSDGDHRADQHPDSGWHRDADPCPPYANPHVEHSDRYSPTDGYAVSHQHTDPDSLSNPSGAADRTGMTAQSRRRSPRRDGRRGAVAVETAVLGTLLVLLFFGALEMGMLMRSRAHITDATREGTRTAAALPRFDGFEQNALAAIRGVLSTDDLDFVTIYKADPATGRPTAGQPFENCVIDCFMYEHQGGLGLVQLATDEWSFADQQACGGLTDTDWVGVYVRSHHTWLTGLLPGSKSLTDHVVMRLEPLELGVPCHP
jgi:hypothetical protein